MTPWQNALASLSALRLRPVAQHVHTCAWAELRFFLRLPPGAVAHEPCRRAHTTGEFAQPEVLSVRPLLGRMRDTQIACQARLCTATRFFRQRMLFARHLSAMASLLLGLLWRMGIGRIVHNTLVVTAPMMPHCACGSSSPLQLCNIPEPPLGPKTRPRCSGVMIQLVLSLPRVSSISAASVLG